MNDGEAAGSRSPEAGSATRTARTATADRANPPSRRAKTATSSTNASQAPGTYDAAAPSTAPARVGAGVAAAPSDEGAEAELRARAIRLWLDDRAKLVFRRPHLASLALCLELRAVIDERLPTAATDGRAVFVNPYWLVDLDEATRSFVLAHEIWHNALLHFARRKGREPARWNIAVDHEVNALLMRDRLEIPEDAVYFPEWSGEGAEQVYEHLESEASVWGELAADVPSGEEGADASGRRGCPSKFGPIAGRRESGWSSTPAPLDVDAWTGRLRTLDSQLAGLIPGALARAVAASKGPNLPWQTLLADFVKRASGGRLQWHPPARRHFHRGLYLPSRRDERLSLALAVDTSASTMAFWPRFARELRAVVKPFSRYEVRLVQCDAGVQGDVRYDEARPVPLALPFRGGGGTSFVPVFERLAAEPPDALIFFTDGVGAAPSGPPPYPVLWTLTPRGARPAPWGAVLSVGDA